MKLSEASAEDPETNTLSNGRQEETALVSEIILIV